MASKNQEQQHPQERIDRPIVDVIKTFRGQEKSKEI